MISIQPLCLLLHDVFGKKNKIIIIIVFHNIYGRFVVTDLNYQCFMHFIIFFFFFHVFCHVRNVTCFFFFSFTNDLCIFLYRFFFFFLLPFSYVHPHVATFCLQSTLHYPLCVLHMCLWSLGLSVCCWVWCIWCSGYFSPY